MSDHFKDIHTLEWQPFFQEYVGDAFKPLGVYINFWQRELPVGSERDFQIMLIDDGAASSGQLSLIAENANGQMGAQASVPFAVPGNGQQTFLIHLKLPSTVGSYWLKAVATPRQRDGADCTTSHRCISLR